MFLEVQREKYLLGELLREHPALMIFLSFFLFIISFIHFFSFSAGVPAVATAAGSLPGRLVRQPVRFFTAFCLADTPRQRRALTATDDGGPAIPGARLGALHAQEAYEHPGQPLRPGSDHRRGCHDPAIANRNDQPRRPARRDLESDSHQLPHAVARTPWRDGQCGGHPPHATRIAPDAIRGSDAGVSRGTAAGSLFRSCRHTRLRAVAVFPGKSAAHCAGGGRIWRIARAGHPR